MNRIFWAALFLSTIGVGSVVAQPATPSASTTPPAVAGANSFTMAQAQKRFEDQGYTQVSALAKDDKSIWRGHAMKDGKAVNVALDYQGNITAN